MAAKWAVTVASNRVKLDDGQAEVVFTVTNQGDDAVAVFNVVLDEDTALDASWFSVAEPQRRVRPGASVSYVMKVAVPADAPPGTHTVQGSVYSADLAPEETYVQSPRVELVIAAAGEPARRPWPWWWFAMAGGAAVLALALVLVLVLGGSDPADEPSSRSGGAVMPELTGLSEREALTMLAERDISFWLTYKQDPDQTSTVIWQSVPAGETVSGQRVVNVHVAVALAAPVVTGPVGVPIVAEGEELVLEWEPGGSPTHEWLVTLYPEECLAGAMDLECSLTEQPIEEPVNVPSYTPELQIEAFNWDELGLAFRSGWILWQVQAVDSFGTPGPASERHVFRTEPEWPDLD